MAPPNKKQAARAAQKAEKKAAAKESQDAPVASVGGDGLLEMAKASVMGSLIVTMAPVLRDFALELKENKGRLAPAKPEPKAMAESENKDANADEGDDSGAPAADAEPAAPALSFELVKSRLTWHNCLGLAQPATGEESKQAWLAMKGLEMDFGPRPSKRGNPSLDRIKRNLSDFYPQYVHILFAMMVLRAFLCRSFFSLLPWALALQVASILAPLDVLPEEKCPRKIREVAPLLCNGLVWLLFLWEAVYKTYLIEKPLYVALIVFHAYAAKPVEK